MSAPPRPSTSAASPASDLTLDPRTYARGLACVHCGLCLPACPTYTETHHEADSPRGRIQLMLALSDGTIPLSGSVKHHLDLCLDCRACETACPSGVVYHELIEETRARFAERQPPRGLVDRFLQAMFFHVFTHPTRLKLALLPARAMQKIGLYPLLRRAGVFRLLPTKLQKMERLLPPDGPLWPRPLPAHAAAGSMDDVFQLLRDETTAAASRKPRVRVGFFETCVGGVMFSHVNRQAAELLVASGADVVSPPAQQCCGAIHHHNGAHDAAMAMARRNIDAFFPPGGPEVDWIVNTVAGCGAMLREYDVLLRDDPHYRDRATRFVARVRDVSEVLLAIGMPEMKHPVREVVTYHDACHLAHAQKVTAAPRQLLARVPGLSLVPLPESDMCCGAAGTYNLTQPEMATRLGERKLRHVEATGAELCVTGNVGCAMHLQSEARQSGRPTRIVHPVELLHRAVFGPPPR